MNATYAACTSDEQLKAARIPFKSRCQSYFWRGFQVLKSELALLRLWRFI